MTRSEVITKAVQESIVEWLHVAHTKWGYKDMRVSLLVHDLLFLHNPRIKSDWRGDVESVVLESLVDMQTKGIISVERNAVTGARTVSLSPDHLVL